MLLKSSTWTRSSGPRHASTSRRLGSGNAPSSSHSPPLIPPPSFPRVKKQLKLQRQQEEKILEVAEEAKLEAMKKLQEQTRHTFKENARLKDELKLNVQENAKLKEVCLGSPNLCKPLLWVGGWVALARSRRALLPPDQRGAAERAERHARVNRSQGQAAAGGCQPRGGL